MVFWGSRPSFWGFSASQTSLICAPMQRDRQNQSGPGGVWCSAGQGLYPQVHSVPDCWDPAFLPGYWCQEPDPSPVSASPHSAAIWPLWASCPHAVVRSAWSDLAVTLFPHLQRALPHRFASPRGAGAWCPVAYSAGWACNVGVTLLCLALRSTAKTILEPVFLIPAAPAEQVLEHCLPWALGWLVTCVLPPQSHDVFRRAEV